MFYKLSFNMDLIDESIKKNDTYIYAETCNIDDIEVAGIKKGFFDKVVYKNKLNIEWPTIEFYYSSLVSKKESDYLLNIKRWPIVHIRVKKALEEANVGGVKYYPISLIDVCTGDVNNNYCLLYIENFIDAYDMSKSEYKYNEKYKFYTFIPKKTYLNFDICKNYSIFRSDKNVSSIYVSDSFCSIIKEKGFVGFVFEQQL